MAGPDGGSGRTVGDRLAALERRASDVEGRVTMIGTDHSGRLDDMDDRAQKLERGFEALVTRAKVLGWESFMRDLEAAGFEVGERATRYGGATRSD